MAEFRTYTAIGQREDLSNTIYSIAPTETPVVSSIGKTKATATLHEWQTDTLAAAPMDANGELECENLESVLGFAPLPDNYD